VLLEADPDDLELSGGLVRDKNNPDRSVAFRHAAGLVHWGPGSLPRALSLYAAAVRDLQRVALAMLANLEEWGGYCARVAEALLTRYELSERAVGFFQLHERIFQGTWQVIPGHGAPDVPQHAS
jgi:hypothetical protein